jgi:hypothetical protein
MSHPALQHWVDRARGVLGDPELAAAEAHLAGGCESCRRTAEVMTLFTQLAGRERDYEAPAAIAERAEAVFPRRESARGGRRLTCLAAQLVYDSMRDPLPLGVRGNDRVNQVLYHAGRYSVDLQINREQGRRESRSPRLIVVGQIADCDEPRRPVSDRPVLLLAGRDVAARTLSNELGEFHLECEPRERLRLQVWISGAQRIEVPVRSFEAGER